jgi:hypothetical protein
MADSPLALLHWFRAIWHMLQQPDLEIKALSRLLLISRAATVRTMVSKITTALIADNRRQLLAGLDVYFRDLSQAPAPETFFENCQTALVDDSKERLSSE